MFLLSWKPDTKIKFTVNFDSVVIKSGNCRKFKGEHKIFIYSIFSFKSVEK
jgi:hypothetical protein